MSQEYSPERETVRTILNDILEQKEGAEPVEHLPNNTSLTDDLGLDSLDLAEMTVRIEDRYGVDVFADDVVDEVGEVLDMIDT